jgi:hypothetical protein
MAGGKYDSSKTRAAPVFNALQAQGGDWVRRLLGLAVHPRAQKRLPASLDLTFLRGHWAPNELGLPPPVSLLSWLIRNPQALIHTNSDIKDRQALFAGDPKTVERALELLRKEAVNRAWYMLEGPTVPDAYIETPDALIVVEGKRTESGPTTSTTWMPNRHQIWRHIDAAWERKGRRQVFGLFIVESDANADIPEHWHGAVRDCLDREALAGSFPHRSAEEQKAIAACMLGATSWQKVLAAFHLPTTTLIDHL